MAQINSSYGDSLFRDKSLAKESFKNYVKPQNHILLKKGKMFLATTNRRSTMFRRDGWKLVCRGTVKGKGFNAIKTPIRCPR